MPPAVDVAVLLGHFGTGGVERVACILANGLAERGVGVAMLAADATGPTRGLVRDGIPVIGLDAHSRWWRSAKLLGSIPALVRFLRTARPKILFSPGNHTHVVAALAHRFAPGWDTALVVKMTNPPVKPWHGWPRRRITVLFYRWVFSRASVVLVLSPGGVEEVRKLGGDAAGVKARFVHNPYVEVRRPDGGSTDPEIDDQRPLILAVGRLTEQKNFALLLRAASSIKGINWRLMLLGEGPQEAALKRLAVELGIERQTVFAGFVEDPGIYYRQASCLALSSRWEDLPAVALEAMAAGCPVVATDCSSALTQMIQATSFGRVVPATSEALAGAIGETLRAGKPTSIPTEVLAYSIENGIADHLTLLQPLMRQGDEARL